MSGRKTHQVPNKIVYATFIREIGKWKDIVTQIVGDMTLFAVFFRNRYYWLKFAYTTSTNQNKTVDDLRLYLAVKCDYFSLSFSVFFLSSQTSNHEVRLRCIIIERRRKRKKREKERKETQKYFLFNKRNIE